jgi:hypothetical protein
MSELVGTLLKKFKHAEKGLAEMALAYDGLADSLDAQSVREWKQQERNVEIYFEFITSNWRKVNSGQSDQYMWINFWKLHPRQKFIFT